MATSKNSENLSVVRALDIIELFITENKTFSITEICNELTMNRVTCSYLLKTLQNKKYIYRTSDGTYTATGKVFVLGQVYKNHLPIIKTFEEIGTALSKKYNIDVILSAMCDVNRAIVLTQTPQYIDYLRATDVYLPLHCTACGKVLLAFQPEKDKCKILSRLELTKYTGHTIVDQKQLLEELDTINKQGYSSDNMEYLDKRTCIGAPIWGVGNKLIAAISFSRFEGVCDYDIGDFLPQLQELANTLSYQMGHRKIFLDNI